ncbi:YlbF family regulator [Bacillus alkalicellulosilyticus]|uniref:YlbF family regulator n=1 Tax=Alkalihalobacterium alkalicellulosilyticum TaxID=1912214 RepID=UPI00099783EE|nr:YlbF family regulator [Bacillus alkalicellulosilyticus]
MITMMTSVDILTGSDTIAKMVVSSEIFAHYQQCKYKLEQDKEAQESIKRFSTWKDRYEEVQRFGKYHPDFETVTTEIRVAKRELDNYESVIAFKAAERELEQLLNEISTILAHEVSENIKVPTGNPYFDSMSCSGGCGSGGSCGCSK